MVSRKLSLNQAEMPFSLTVDEIGKMLGLCRNRAYKLANSKGFPSKRIGKRLVIPTDLFLKWIEKK